MATISGERVLVLMPTARDGERTARVLGEAGLDCVLCADMDHFCREIQSGAGAGLLTEEAVDKDREGFLRLILNDQPPWSDFPLVVLARQEGMGHHLRESTNATLVERPVKIRSLLSVLRAALRSRRHQYAVRDLLSERQAAEESLQFALNAGRLGSWELDLGSGLLNCSDLCKANFGRPSAAPFTYEDLIGSIHPEDREHVRSAISDSVTGRADFDVEFRNLWPDGTAHWVLVRGRVAHAPAGEPAKIAGVSMDVTERKLAEEQLKDAAARKDDFIALLAHELRNPLAPIRNGLNVMRLAGADDEAVREIREIMDRQITHMVRLIDDLLDLSRINRNKMDLRLSRVTLAEAVDGALETARPIIDAGQHSLEVSIPDRPIYLEADLMRLAQVFSNLLTNSAKYTRRGGKIWLIAEERGGEVTISVRDSGIGIPAEALDNIFDMFSQLDRSVERTTGGLGIGLALVKGLVEMHGGKVIAESGGEGRGSTFSVTLPVAEALADRVSALDVDGRPEARRRILVVDDSRDSASSLARVLELMGNDVRTAHDGREGIDVASEFIPEVVLMDVGMPRMGGLEATRQIRAQEWGRDMLIIALTGWGQEQDRERSRDAGCDAHLVKPVDLDALEKLLGAGRCV